MIWQRYEGPNAPDEKLVDITFQSEIVQSILPAEGSQKHISFMIKRDGTIQNFSHAKDSDPND